MKLTIAAITAAAALAGCTATPAMIDAQKSRCTQVGYQPGTMEHAQCTERGTAQQQGAQNATAAGLGGYTAGSIIANALF